MVGGDEERRREGREKMEGKKVGKERNRKPNEGRSEGK